jgi:hypothetical protein
VIVVQKNNIRRENLLKELAGKYNHRMFWLATEEDRLTFQTPKDFAGPQSRRQELSALNAGGKAGFCPSLLVRHKGNSALCASVVCDA